MKENVLVLIKPDGMIKGLMGVILDKFQQEDLEIVGMKMVTGSRNLAKEHYKQLFDKPFFDELIDYLSGEIHGSEKMLAIVYRGDNVIKVCRYIVGATNPEEADPLTIRGAFGRIKTNGLFENVVHASSTKYEAEREIKLWFSPDELDKKLYKFSTKKESVERNVW